MHWCRLLNCQCAVFPVWCDVSEPRLYTDAGFGRQIDMSVGEAFSAYIFSQFCESQASQHAFAQSLQGINEHANESLRELVDERFNSPLPSLRGFAFEIEHARSFNEDALRKGSPFRAEHLGINSHAASDVNIIDTRDGTIVDQVQCKASDDHSWVRRHLASMAELGFWYGDKKTLALASCWGT